MVQKRNFLLGNRRALDLTDENGLLCGKILADLGVDVIKIEKPSGDPSRRFGPFHHDIPHPEKSLFWFAYNLNKRGITLDIETEDGRSLFKRLIQTADFVIESFSASYMDRIGLGYSVLSSINPRIIMISVTPFGQVGQHKNWKSSDIVSMAMGGFMALVGDEDMPPVRISVDQASLHACAEGAVASLIADYERQKTGVGQHVDVSIQASIVATTISAVPYWEITKYTLKRSGPYRVGLRKGGKRVRQQWPCKDGFIGYAVWGGMAGAQSNQSLVEWMDSECMADDNLKQMDWSNYDLATVDDALVQKIEESIGKFFLSHTKYELYQGALERRVQLYPVYTIKEMVNSPQLNAREFWVNLEHPELDSTVTYPGAIAKSSEIDLAPYRRAPLIGEHNVEIYEGELGLSRAELITLKQAKVI